MKLILLENINKLGTKGEEVEVKEGYGRNFLIPNNLAVLPSDPRAKELKNTLESLSKEKEQKMAAQQEMAKELEGKELIFKVKAEKTKLFASIDANDIAKKLEHIEARQVVLDEPIKELGEYQAKINFGQGAISNIKIKVEKE